MVSNTYLTERSVPANVQVVEVYLLDYSQLAPLKKNKKCSQRMSLTFSILIKGKKKRKCLQWADGSQCNTAQRCYVTNNSVLIWGERLWAELKYTLSSTVKENKLTKLSFLIIIHDDLKSKDIPCWVCHRLKYLMFIDLCRTSSPSYWSDVTAVCFLAWQTCLGLFSILVLYINLITMI